MKRLTLRISSVVAAVIIGVGTVCVPPKADAAIIGGLAAIAGELIAKIPEWIEGGDEIAKLMVLIINTDTQINQMKENFQEDSERYQQFKKGLDHLKELKTALDRSRYAYYAAQSVTRFYQSVGDYWNYAKTNGFSNYRSTLYTIDRGMYFAKAVTKDAVAIAFLLKDKDENGNNADLTAAERSSRVGQCFQRIQQCFDAWNKILKLDGVLSPQQEEDSAIIEQTFDPDSPINICSYGRWGQSQVDKNGNIKIQSHGVIK